MAHNSLPEGIQPSPCMAQAFSGQAALLLEIPASPMPQTDAPQHPCKDKKQKHKTCVDDRIINSENKETYSLAPITK